MGKYYMVYLEYENFCTICKKFPFNKNLYQEIITNKIIYPKGTPGKLTYDCLPNNLQRCYEITNSQAKEWLYNLNAEEYIYNLERFEYIVTKMHKIEIKEKRVYKKKEKLAGREIKRKMRKIK